MKPRTVVLLAIAVGSGLLAMLGVQQAMSNNQSQPEEMVNVLVALQDIEVGVQLTDQVVAFRSMPRSAVTVEDPITTPDQYERRSPTYGLKSGDIVRQSKLSAPGNFGKSTQIPEGMRVHFIPVDDTHTMGGLLSPGDRVDVIVTYSHRGDRGQQVTKTMTLLEYVEVFATDDKTLREANQGDQNKSKTRIVGLLLPPEHVPYVILAQSKGKLSISWRRRDDDTVASVGSINEEALDELKGITPFAGDRSGRNPFAEPLYGDEVGVERVGADLDGFGGPQAAATPPAHNVDAMLTAAEGGTTPAPPAPVAPPRPTWKLAIFNGNQEVQQEFEIPETPPLPEVPAKELQELHEQVQGSKVWDLLRQVL